MTALGLLFILAFSMKSVQPQLLRTTTTTTMTTIRNNYNACSTNPCQNNGICLVVGGVAQCLCFAGFFLPFCTTQTSTFQPQFFQTTTHTTATSRETTIGTFRPQLFPTTATSFRP